MIRASKALVAGIVVSVFILAVTCVASAAAGNSANHCSQISQPMDMSECDHPAYVCRFAAAGLLSQGFRNPPRSKLQPNGSEDFTRFGVAIAVLSDSALEFARGRQDVDQIPRLSRVSVHLFNSVLNL